MKIIAEKKYRAILLPLLLGLFMITAVLFACTDRAYAMDVEYIDESGLMRTAENCIRKSIMSGTLKHRIQGICEKNLIVFRTVNPKNTSNTCHLCGNDKHLKDSESKKLISGGMKWRELVDYCAGHGKNLRAGETFICGGEKCKLHGVSQDADWNAAMVIAKRGFGETK
jgi:hypothetical protein